MHLCFLSYGNKRFYFYFIFIFALPLLRLSMCLHGQHIITYLTTNVVALAFRPGSARRNMELRILVVARDEHCKCHFFVVLHWWWQRQITSDGGWWSTCWLLQSSSIAQGLRGCCNWAIPRESKFHTGTQIEITKNHTHATTRIHANDQLHANLILTAHSYQHPLFCSSQQD